MRSSDTSILLNINNFLQWTRASSNIWGCFVWRTSKHCAHPSAPRIDMSGYSFAGLQDGLPNSSFYVGDCHILPQPTILKHRDVTQHRWSSKGKLPWFYSQTKGFYRHKSRYNNVVFRSRVAGSLKKIFKMFTKTLRFQVLYLDFLAPSWRTFFCLKGSTHCFAEDDFLHVAIASSTDPVGQSTRPGKR